MQYYTNVYKQLLLQSMKDLHQNEGEHLESPHEQAIPSQG